MEKRELPGIIYYGHDLDTRMNTRRTVKLRDEVTAERYEPIRASRWEALAIL